MSELGGESDDRASRILVLSLGAGSHLAAPSLHNLVHAIKGPSPATTAPEDITADPGPIVSSDAERSSTADASSFEYRAGPSEGALSHDTPVAWNISNRYYEAKVHFVVRSIPLQRPRAARRDQRTAGRSAIASASDAHTLATDAGARSQTETDEQLRDRARDVFAALEAPSRGATSSQSRQPVTSTIAEAHALSAIQEASRDVPAVVLVVDREQPFSVHRDMLVALSTSWEDASVPSLSGHDLDVSLVLGIPSPMANASLDTAAPSRGDRPSEEQLAELYAQEGWEYVDLISSAEADLYDDDDLDGPEEGAMDDVGAGAAEEHGFDRIREALETHLWPGLVRKDDRASRLAERERRQREEREMERAVDAAPPNVGALQSFSDFQESMRNDREDEDAGRTSLDASGARGSSDDDAEEARLTALLDAVLVQLGGSSLEGTSQHFEPGSAEVTQEDEALARAFMEQIAKHEGVEASTAASAAAAEATSMSRAREELEKFLDEQGGQEWLASGSAPSPSAPTQDVEVVGTTAQEGGFDDDFADFVAAPRSDESSFGRSAALGTGAGAGALGAEPDDPDFDFASALHSVRAQAERVRAIQDPERRREEAARVALAFGNQLG